MDGSGGAGPSPSGDSGSDGEDPLGDGSPDDRSREDGPEENGAFAEDRLDAEEYGAELIGRTDAAVILTTEQYAILHGIALNLVRGFRSTPTLCATSLVNEACLRILDRDRPEMLRIRSFVAEVMRNILRDSVRRRKAAKRGGGLRRVTLHSGIGPLTKGAIDCEALDDALERMSTTNEKLYKTIEWSYFGGLEQQEIADQLGVSDRTVRNYLDAGTAWLREQLEPRRG